MTPMCREMVSQVMVSQVLPAERGGGTRSGRRVPKNPIRCQEALKALKPQVPRCPGMLENAAYAGGETGPAREKVWWVRGPLVCLAEWDSQPSWALAVAGLSGLLAKAGRSLGAGGGTHGKPGLRARTRGPLSPPDFQSLAAGDTRSSQNENGKPGGTSCPP